jgi:hypothetical protein
MLSVIVLVLAQGLQQISQFAVSADDQPDPARRPIRHIVVGIGQPLRASSGIPWTLVDEDEEGIRLYEYDYVYDEFDDKLPKQPRPEYVMRVTAPSRKEWVWRFEPEGRVHVRAGGVKTRKGLSRLHNPALSGQGLARTGTLFASGIPPTGYHQPEKSAAIIETSSRGVENSRCTAPDTGL